MNERDGYHVLGVALLEKCSSLGVLSITSDSFGGQRFYNIDLRNGGSLMVTSGKSLHGRSFWEFDFNKCLQMPYKRVAFWMDGSSIESYHLSPREGVVTGIDVFLTDGRLSVARWLKSRGGLRRVIDSKEAS